MTPISMDQVTRLRVMAAGLRGAVYAEEHVDVPYERMWAVAADLGSELPTLVAGLREFRIPPGESDRKHGVAVGVLGLRDHFDVRLAPGWCLMQSGLIVGAMAAVPDDGGGTRFAVLSAIRPAVLAPVRLLYGKLLGAGRGRAFIQEIARRAAQVQDTE